MRFYWRDYIAAQLNLAECLLEKSDVLVGYDPGHLQRIAHRRLMDVNRLQLSVEFE